MKKVLLVAVLGCAGALSLVAEGAEARSRHAAASAGQREQSDRAKGSVRAQPADQGAPQARTQQGGGQQSPNENAQGPREREETGNAQQGSDQANSTRQGSDTGPAQAGGSPQESESGARRAANCRPRYRGPILDASQDVSLRAVMQVAKRAFYEASAGDDTISQSDLASPSAWSYFYSPENYGKSLTRREFLSLVEDMFEEVDRNHDGVLEPRELQSRRGEALLDIIEG